MAKVGRPTKLNNWLEAFKEIVSDGFNAVYLTDEELLILTNDRLPEVDQVSDRTFKSWKSGDIQDQLLDEFLPLYKKALIEQKKALFERMEGDDDKWQKWAWIIERKFAEWNLKNISEIKQDTKITAVNLKDLVKFE